MDKKALYSAFFVTLVFVFGFLTSDLYTRINTEQPFVYDETVPKESPGDWIKEPQIRVNDARVVLELENAEWAAFTDTHSMEPVLSAQSNAIEVHPKTPEDIKVGDIASYVSAYSDGFIIHRVIEKGYDDEGYYFIFKGDNNLAPDPERVRFEQIQRVVVAIIY